jgi:hypothetical protein
LPHPRIRLSNDTREKYRQDQFKLSRDIENAFLADCCVELVALILNPSADANAELQRIAKEVNFCLRPTAKDRKQLEPEPKPFDRRLALLKMWRGAIASPKTPSRLRNALIRKLEGL